MKSCTKRALAAGASVLWLAGCSCGVNEGPGFDANTDTDLDGVDLGPCTDGQMQCVGDVLYTCVGGLWQARDCGAEGLRCHGELGCVLCYPGLNYCDGQLSMRCNEDGMGGTLVEDCDLDPLKWCDEASGLCIDACGEAALERSNVGCEYWAVDLDNAENVFDDASAGQFAVAVANVNMTYRAEVWVYRDASGYGEPVSEEEVSHQMVDTGEIWIFRLPRYDVDGPSITDHYDDGPQTALSKRSYRVVSSVPVVAYQFNTLDQQFSNDASLLIPTTALGELYHVVGWGPTNPIAIPAMGLHHPNRAYVTVVGTKDGTTVWVTPTFDIEASVGAIPAGFQAVPELAADGRYEFNLNPYEVLNLENKSMLSPYPDLTGTIVESNEPVVVFTGVDLATAAGETPPGCESASDCSCCAEHVEQQVIPKVSMGWTYVVSHSAWRHSGGGWIEFDYYKVLAVRDGTHVSTSLPDVGSFDIGANEVYEFKARTGFTLDASQPVQVLQVLTTQLQTEDNIGDSSFIPFPAVEQRRSYYVFTTGEGFSENWAVVSMPEGTDATIDDFDVASTCSPSPDGTLGSVAYTAWYCEIEDGHHVVDAGEQPVGVTVYGYYGAGSYGYPAGSDLREIFLE
ncbi:MAG: IgGFc-binding protein [Deltaproteobacteria bacterium]|nr:IgGFc-binding protein [Deltaproteobacteria bacterium]